MKDILNYHGFIGSVHFSADDSIFYGKIEGISDLITQHGTINVDFADVKAIMENSGSALMGVGRATGESRATDW